MIQNRNGFQPGEKAITNDKLVPINRDLKKLDERVTNLEECCDKLDEEIVTECIIVDDIHVNGKTYTGDIESEGTHCACNFVGNCAVVTDAEICNVNVNCIDGSCAHFTSATIDNFNFTCTDIDNLTVNCDLHVKGTSCFECKIDGSITNADCSSVSDEISTNPVIHCRDGQSFDEWGTKFCIQVGSKCSNEINVDQAYCSYNAHDSSNFDGCSSECWRDYIASSCVSDTTKFAGKNCDEWKEIIKETCVNNATNSTCFNGCTYACAKADILSGCAACANDSTCFNGCTYACAKADILSGCACYADTATNLASNPQLSVGSVCSDNITVTAGNKTSQEFTVPYACKATNSDNATSSTCFNGCTYACARADILSGCAACANDSTCFNGCTYACACADILSGCACKADEATNLKDAPAITQTSTCIYITAGGKNSNCLEPKYAKCSCGTLITCGASNGTFSLLMDSQTGNASGYRALYKDCGNNITYNPSSDILQVPHLNASCDVCSNFICGKCCVRSPDVCGTCLTGDNLCVNCDVNIDGNTVIGGDLTVNGTMTTIHAQDVSTCQDTITLRDCATTAIGGNCYSGLKITKYDGTCDLIVGVDNQGTLKVGTNSSNMEAFATRAEACCMEDGYAAHWDCATKKLETSGTTNVHNLCINGNATSTGNITANSFTGALTGNADTATNATCFNGCTYACAKADILSGNAASSTNATCFNGCTYACAKADILSGNAASSTKLETAKCINGTAFDGTCDITTDKWGTARNVSISDCDGTNTSGTVSVDGSANATLKLPSTIKATITGNADTSCCVQTDTTTCNGTCYVTLSANNTSGKKAIYTNANLTYNPSTGNLGACKFTGALAGNADTATNSTCFNGCTYACAKADILSGCAADSNKFNGCTYACAKADILSGCAADSNKFNGKTYACACADIRSGLSGDTCFDVYCGACCLCTVTNGCKLCLSANAFNTNATISTTTYPGACCTGTVVASDIADFICMCDVDACGYTTCTGTVTSVNVSVNGTSGTAITGNGTVTLTGVKGAGTCVYDAYCISDFTTNCDRPVVLSTVYGACTGTLGTAKSTCPQLTYNPATGRLTSTIANFTQDMAVPSIYSKNGNYLENNEKANLTFISRCKNSGGTITNFCSYICGSNGKYYNNYGFSGCNNDFDQMCTSSYIKDDNGGRATIRLFMDVTNCINCNNTSTVGMAGRVIRFRPGGAQQSGYGTFRAFIDYAGTGTCKTKLYYTNCGEAGYPVLVCNNGTYCLGYYTSSSSSIFSFSYVGRGTVSWGKEACYNSGGCFVDNQNCIWTIVCRAAIESTSFGNITSNATTSNSMYTSRIYSPQTSNTNTSLSLYAHKSDNTNVEVAKICSDGYVYGNVCGNLCGEVHSMSIKATTCCADVAYERGRIVAYQVNNITCMPSTGAYYLVSYDNTCTYSSCNYVWQEAFTNGNTYTASGTTADKYFRKYSTVCGWSPWYKVAKVNTSGCLLEHVNANCVDNATSVNVAANTATRKALVTNQIEGSGYVTRAAIGLCRTSGWGNLLLSVGCNDAGTAFYDYCFYNNGTICGTNLALCGTAKNAAYVNRSAATTGTCHLLLACANTAATETGVYVSTACPLTFDPSTGVLTAKCFCGNVTATGTIENATCFNGCTYACACADIRSGLTSCTGDVTILDKNDNVSYPVAICTGTKNVGKSSCYSLTFNPSNGTLQTNAFCGLYSCAACFKSSNTIIKIGTSVGDADSNCSYAIAIGCCANVTGSCGLAIGNTAGAGFAGIAIGYCAKACCYESTSIGYRAGSYVTGGLALGYFANSGVCCGVLFSNEVTVDDACYGRHGRMTITIPSCNCNCNTACGLKLIWANEVNANRCTNTWTTASCNNIPELRAQLSGFWFHGGSTCAGTRRYSSGAHTSDCYTSMIYVELGYDAACSSLTLCQLLFNCGCYVRTPHWIWTSGTDIWECGFIGTITY